ncbi:4'-phosphopantetheinyl transferase family protein [Granulicoccus sp. GXG6511]|uniref:4'-phosphopantetheinyl transferase family protein n=1 Tax=Granulicoccus sp. GXG6511 TaxID=3381351 RepID=UPI003D7E660C
MPTPAIPVELWRARVRPLDPAFLVPADRRRWDELTMAADRDRLATAVRLRNHVLRAHGHPTQVCRWCAVCRSAGHGAIRAPGPLSWRMSVSHADEMVVIAYAESASIELGVDIEQIARFRPEMAPFVLGRGEAGGGAVELAETWTAKEAVLKAAGCGLHVNPTALAVRRRAPGGAAVGVLTPHPLLAPVRDRPGVLTDVTTTLGLDRAAWRAALFVLGVTRIDLRVRPFTGEGTPARRAPGGHCCSTPGDPASRTCC